MDGPRFCPSCGSALFPGSKFCGRCGVPLVAKRGGGAFWKIGFVVAALVAAGAVVWIFVFGQAAAPAVGCPGGTCPAFDPGREARLSVKGTGGDLDKVRVVVPPGAVEAKVALQIMPAPPESRPPRMADPEIEADPQPAGPVVRFGPDGLRFAKPLRVTLPYDPAKVPAGRTPAVVLYDANRAERLEPIRVDAGNGVVEVAIAHFSDALVILDPGRDVVFTSVGPSNPERFGPSAWGPSKPAVAGPPAGAAAVPAARRDRAEVPVVARRLHRPSLRAGQVLRRRSAGLPRVQADRDAGRGGP